MPQHLRLTLAERSSDIGNDLKMVKTIHRNH